MFAYINKVMSLIRRKGIFRAIYILFFVIVKKVYFYFVPKMARYFAKSVDDNLVLFDSPSYSDNAKVLSDYILNNTNYKVVWIVNNKIKIENRKNLITVSQTYLQKSRFKHIYTIGAFYYAYKAKYVFYTHSFNWAGYKNPNQIIINLWHGSGYKARKEPKSGIRLPDLFDFMIVPGELFVKSKAEFFECEPTKIIPLGYPRYDTFKIDSSIKVNNFFVNLDLLENDSQKIIIWLPTFVGDDDLLSYQNPLPYIISGIPILEKLQHLQDLDKFCFENNIKILIKRHRLEAKRVPLEKHFKDLKSIVVLTNDNFEENEIDLYELLPHTDALISDFSSVSVDYLLLDKPIAYVVTDIEDYRKTRGFVFDDPLLYMPGEHIYNFDDLKKFILHIATNNDNYFDVRKNAIEIMHNKTDNYSERIISYFFK